MAKLTDKQAQLLLDKNFGSLAVVTDEGWPEVTPVWVDWDGDYVLVNTARGRGKEVHIGRDPRVELSVVSSENPYQHVRIRGHAELVDEGAEEHIDELAKKYMGKDRYPRGPGERRVLIRIRPERVVDQALD